MEPLSARAFDAVPGDMLGLPIPADSAALRAGGVAFLTRAFHASGALAHDNRVTRITQFAECPGGSTGRKLLLAVDYERPTPGLHRELFVKFSRDFDDKVRDQAKMQLALEVRFAALSRNPGFPIAVPVCYFADFHQQTGTGILITERVAFGQDGIEPHQAKCLDYEMAAPLEHYQALIKALARLAGTHKAGKLPNSVAQQFPFDPGSLSVSDRAPPSADQLRRRVDRYAGFASKFPQFLPQNIRSPQFLTRLADEVALFLPHEAAINHTLCSKPDLIALCHWNANIDNAWFWRNASGGLECGLMDWGNVSQMNVGMALWGALSAAETSLWDDHIDALLRLFLAEFRRCGGPSLDAGDLTLQLELHVAVMGLRWLLDVPGMIEKQFPDLADFEGRTDPRFKTHEAARARLQMMTVFLNLWETRDFGKSLGRFLADMPLPL